MDTPIVTPLTSEVIYRLPLGDLVAIGKVLYIANEDYLEDEGLTAAENNSVQRAFDAIDAVLETLVGPEWLGALTDEKPEEPKAPVAANVTPFAELVRRMK